MKKGKKALISITFSFFLINILLALYSFGIIKFESPVNVSRDELHSYSPVMVLDKNDNPHIVWRSRGDDLLLYSGDLFYAKWDGSSWVNVKGERGAGFRIETEIPKYEPKEIFIDSNGNPLIVTGISGYANADYLWWDGSSWKNHINVYSHGYFELFTEDYAKIKALTLDSNDNIHFLLEKNNRLGLFLFDGKSFKTIDRSQIESIDAHYYINGCFSTIKSCDIKLDNKGLPHILINERDENLYYIRWNGKSWITVDGKKFEKDSSKALVTCESGEIDADMRLDADDNPHILFSVYEEDDVGNQVFDLNIPVSYIRWDCNNWVYLDGTRYNQGNLSSILVKALWSGTSYSFDVDDENLSHLVWNQPFDREQLNPDLCHIRWDGEGWITENKKRLDETKCFGRIEKSLNKSFSPFVVLDSNGYPNIVWCDKIHKTNKYDIMFVRWNGDEWVAANGKRYR